MNQSEVAERFLAAVYEGDAALVWELLSPEAREFVISRGMRKGLSAELARSLLEGTGDEIERAEFLGDLLSGLEKDLETVDLGLIHVDPEGTIDRDGAKFVFYESFVIEAGPPLDPLPVGTVELVESDGDWRVRRLIPGPPGTD